MPVEFQDASVGAQLKSAAIFLGASIPDPGRWPGEFNPGEITDAVVAAARAVLSAGGRLVSGAHPTITPLLLSVAAEFPAREDKPLVLAYQSALFESVLPAAVRRFESDGVGELRMTPAVPGDSTGPGRWEASLRLMRERMFTETQPAAGIFIGGMEGIAAELRLLRELMPNAALYPVARPGGESARLLEFAPPQVRELLAESGAYPTVFRKVVDDLASRPRPER
jgi:SLOG cluster3 family